MFSPKSHTDFLDIFPKIVNIRPICSPCSLTRDPVWVGMMPKKSRRDMILDAAEKRFMRVGFKKTTLEEVAKDLGMVKSALYKYFSNKDDLFQATVQRVAQTFCVNIEQALSDKKPVEERLRTMLYNTTLGVFDRILNNDISLEVWSEIQPHLWRHLNQLHRTYIEMVAAIIQDGIASGELRRTDARMASQTLHYVMDSFIEEFILREVSREEGLRFVDFAVEVLMNGIRNREAGA